MELDTRYDPKELEPRIYADWEKRGYFHADPADPRHILTVRKTGYRLEGATSLRR